VPESKWDIAMEDVKSITPVFFLKQVDKLQDSMKKIENGTKIRKHQTPPTRLWSDAVGLDHTSSLTSSADLSVSKNSW
jgi:hypothetical protein